MTTENNKKENKASGSEHWLKEFWRPMCAIIYLAIVVFDFVIFPSVLAFLSFKHGQPYVQYQSITLQSGGLIHLSFGTILGLSAYTRGMAQIKGTEAK
jgi:hypothetical protein